MTATLFQPSYLDISYNGWCNYSTWNVALWLQNDEGLYNLCQDCNSYDEVLEVLYNCGSKETPDGVKWNSAEVNHIQLNSNLFDH